MDSNSVTDLPSKNNFTGLRFLLAFIVVLCHLSELSALPAFAFLYNNLSSLLAIHGFFVISGFLIYRSYIRNPEWKIYIEKRLKRIFPAYLAVVVICALTLVSVSTFSASEYYTSSAFWKYLLANFFTLNFIQPDLPGVFQDNLYHAVNGSLWTIKVELAFYFILPLIVWLLFKTNKKYHFWIFLMLYAWSVLYAEFFNFLYEKTNREIFNTLIRQLPGKLCYFVSGMFIYHYFEIFKRHSQLLLLISIPLLFFATHFQVEILAPASLAVIIIYLALCTPPLLSGLDQHDFSYGIYLWHFPIIQFFTCQHLFDKNPWTMFGLAITLIISVAALSWYGLEKKILNSKF